MSVTVQPDSDAVAVPGDNQPPLGVHHIWPMRRTQRAFRCAVVETHKYDPAGHAQLFSKVVGQILTPSVTDLEAPAPDLPEALDLVTWPEAFLPHDTLVATLTQLAEVTDFPCFHVGLRPDHKDETHLFTNEALRGLVEELSALGAMVASDLAHFSRWLETAKRGKFGVACLFFVDARGDLRVCLHPKNTASPMEIKALPNDNVTEADFTSIVSLISFDDATLFPVHIQPVICSDYLDLNRQVHRPGPLAILSSAPGRIGSSAPDHIDIVSVPTCTPHKEQAAGGLPPRLNWHGDFRSTMTDMPRVGRFARHRHAVTVLANARRVYGKPAGLSGCFVPLPLPSGAEFPEFNLVWSWGRQHKRDNEWMPFDKDRPLEGWSSLGPRHPRS